MNCRGTIEYRFYQAGQLACRVCSPYLDLYSITLAVHQCINTDKAEYASHLVNIYTISHAYRWSFKQQCAWREYQRLQKNFPELKKQVEGFAAVQGNTESQREAEETWQRLIRYVCLLFRRVEWF